MAYKKYKSTREDIDELRLKYCNSEPNEYKQLTKKELHFLYQYVYNCKEAYTAFEIAYPAKDGRERSREYCQSKAWQILNRPHVKRRYKEMEEDLQKDLQKKGLWTREQSINCLKKIIKSNFEELERIDDTYNKEVEELSLEVEEAKTTNERKKLYKQTVSIRKKLRNNSTNNNAILSAISELNKMHGYNAQEVTIKHDEEFEIDKKFEKMSIEDLTALIYKKENE